MFANVYTPRDEPPQQPPAATRSRFIPPAQSHYESSLPTGPRPSASHQHRPPPPPVPASRPTQAYQAVYNAPPANYDPHFEHPPSQPPASAFSSQQSYQDHLRSSVRAAKYPPPTPPPPPPTPPAFAHMSDYHREIMAPIIEEQQRKARLKQERERANEAPMTTFDVPSRTRTGTPVQVSGGGGYASGSGGQGRW